MTATDITEHYLKIEKAAQFDGDEIIKSGSVVIPTLIHVSKIIGYRQSLAKMILESGYKSHVGQQLLEKFDECNDQIKELLGI